MRCWGVAWGFSRRSSFVKMLLRYSSGYCARRLLMTIEKPTYIVAELPDELSVWVKSIRATFEPAISHMAEEVTLTGSSGIGVLTEGQDLHEVGNKIQEVIKGKTDFSFKLLGIGNFEGTDIFFLEPEREGFDQLHNALRESDIEFEGNSFPYKPHCSLKGFTPLQVGQRERLESLDVPEGSYQVKCISVYEIENMQPQKLLSFGL